MQVEVEGVSEGFNIQMTLNELLMMLQRWGLQMTSNHGGPSIKIFRQGVMLQFQCPYNDSIISLFTNGCIGTKNLVTRVLLKKQLGTRDELNNSMRSQEVVS